MEKQNQIHADGINFSNQHQTTAFTYQQNGSGSYCGRLYRNRRQTSSVAGGLLMMLISGLHIGWGIWRIYFLVLWSASAGLLTFIVMAFSVGAFCGVFLGAILTPMLKKNVIYYATASCMLVGNLLLIIWDEHTESIIVSRLLIGAAHGIVYVAVITHAGENAAKNMRGTILSIINCLFYTGIFVSVVITGTPTLLSILTISAERIIGILGVLLAVGSIGCTIMANVETVPFLLRRNNRFGAITNLKILRDSPMETLELTQEIDEFDSMVAQDKQTSGNIFSNGNGKPLLLMTMMRLMVALTNNVLINFLTNGFATALLLPFQIRLVPLIVVAPRLAMSFMQIFYADVFKRKIQIIVSATTAGIILILFGILVNTLTASTFWDLYTYGILYGVLWLVFQFSCSIGMDQMQDVYLSEAFSTAKKPWSIAFVTGFEHLFHIFMIGMFYVGLSTTAQVNALIFCTGVGIILIAVTLMFTLPETHRLSLRAARDSFANRFKIISPLA